MVSESINKIRNLPIKLQRTTTQKLWMVYYQLFQLQNFAENVNSLRELKQGGVKPRMDEFDPNISIGKIAQIFKTQASM